MSARASRVHVERTGLPGVLLWVCHLEAVPDGSHQPPDGTALRDLIRGGVIDTVSTRDGDLLVRFARHEEIGDPAVVDVVHRAVIGALSDTAWLNHPVSTDVRIRPR